MTDSNTWKHSRLVQQDRKRRELGRVGGEISELAYSQPDDVQAVLDQAVNLVSQVAECHGEDTLKPFSQRAIEALGLLLERQQSQTLRGTPTGFIDLDKMLSGLKPGALVVVGARTAMGKTSFISNIASHVAFREQQPALLFTLEMESIEIDLRVLSAENKVDSKSMYGGKLSDDEWRRIATFADTYENAPLFVDDSPNPNILEIRATARRVKHKQGALGLVIVDYLQLMSGRGGAENRQVEVAEISRELKNLASELECPVIVVSQLSRNFESRSDKRPILSDLRESGSIEEVADVVLFLYRDEVHHEQPEPEVLTDVIVAKNRTGPLGTVTLNFEPRFTRFSSHTPRTR